MDRRTIKMMLPIGDIEHNGSLHDPVSATIAAAVIGAGSSIYSTKQQQKAAEEERRRLAEAERQRKLEAERIARETRPEGESLQAITFGAESTKDTMGSTTDFLVTKGTAGLGTSGTSSGLGFNV